MSPRPPPSGGADSQEFFADPLTPQLDSRREVRPGQTVRPLLVLTEQAARSLSDPSRPNQVPPGSPTPDRLYGPPARFPAGCTLQRWPGVGACESQPWGLRVATPRRPRVGACESQPRGLRVATPRRPEVGASESIQGNRLNVQRLCILPRVHQTLRAVPRLGRLQQLQDVRLQPLLQPLAGG